MSNTVTTLFPDEPQPQSVDISGLWNYWRPYIPQRVWITGMTPVPVADEPEEVDEEPEEDEDEEDEEPGEDEESEQTGEDEECLTLTINDVEAMLRRVIKEELGSLRIVQGNE